MASILYSLFLILIVIAIPTFSAHSPQFPPSPSPQFNPPSPSPSPQFNSPSPSPSDLSPSQSPELAPDVAADVGHDDQTAAGDLKADGHSGGMNAGKKAGVAIGIIAAACIVGVGAAVYKKRQRNHRRSQYSYVTRREIL